MSTEGELWHIVEAKRDDGTPTMFRIRELDPLRHLDRIFVVEMPYPAMDRSRLPDAAAYRRLAEFDEHWLRPACTTLGWELVGSKTEDGSFFLYMYGAGDPNELLARLSPFDGGLGFYDDTDPEWLEYGTLRELLDQAKAIPHLEAELGAAPDLVEPDETDEDDDDDEPVSGVKPAPPKKPTKKPAKKPAKPAKKPAKPAKKPAKPAAAKKPAKKPAKPAKKPAKPAKKPAKPKRKR